MNIVWLYESMEVGTATDPLDMINLKHEALSKQ